MNRHLGRNPHPHSRTHPLFQPSNAESSLPGLIPIKDALDNNYIQVGFWNFRVFIQKRVRICYWIRWKCFLGKLDDTLIWHELQIELVLDPKYITCSAIHSNSNSIALVKSNLCVLWLPREWTLIENVWSNWYLFLTFKATNNTVWCERTIVFH